MDSFAQNRYLDLLKRAVNQYLYLGDTESISDYFADADVRYDEFHWKVPRSCQPHSVLQRSQLDLLETLVIRIHESGVPGDLLEAGVWRGGAVILMLALVELHRMDRTVIAADSFAGIPYSESTRTDPVDRWTDRWEAGLDEVRTTIARYGLLSDRVRFVRGPFKDTLRPGAFERLALIRIDADSYESTTQALEGLYPAVSPGGIVVIDDWHLPGCVVAVSEFRRRHAIEAPLVHAARNVYWVKM